MVKICTLSLFRLHQKLTFNHSQTLCIYYVFCCVCMWCTVVFQSGKTALDRARDNNHKDVTLLLARDPQVSVKIKLT